MKYICTWSSLHTEILMVNWYLFMWKNLTTCPYNNMEEIFFVKTQTSTPAEAGTIPVPNNDW